MLKNISNLGTALNKKEQQAINGGKATQCNLNFLWCPPGCECHVDEVRCELVQICSGGSSF